MEYLYYSGILFIGCKDFPRAFSSLSSCIAVPANVASAIAIEALKKYILVSLTLHARIMPLPKHTPAVISSTTVKNAISNYYEFAQAFEVHPPTLVGKVQSELSRHQQVFSDDNNFGLAKQAIAAL